MTSLSVFAVRCAFLVVVSLVLHTPRADAAVCVRARAIDGDTIRCANGRKIRLKNVDAPELNEPGGRAARDRLARAINGRTFRYRPEGRSYDRDIARVPGIDQRTVGPRGGRGAQRASPRRSAG